TSGYPRNGQAHLRAARHTSGGRVGRPERVSSGDRRRALAGFYIWNSALRLELSYDLRRDLPCVFDSSGSEADRSYPGVTASTIPFTDCGQIVCRLLCGPWVRSDGNLSAKTRRADRDGIGRTGEQIVRNELVVTFDVIAIQVEENHATIFVGSPPDDL